MKCAWFPTLSSFQFSLCHHILRKLSLIEVKSDNDPSILLFFSLTFGVSCLKTKGGRMNSQEHINAVLLVFVGQGHCHAMHPACTCTTHYSFILILITTCCCCRLQPESVSDLNWILHFIGPVTLPVTVDMHISFVLT
ncbi:hypothetical protein Ahy_A08g037603 isoform B [Arachis hypogaea]|uniref:Uncharacterized protein n=1 Tax=Arachis hypogaea TaxID=3818 RepID=A0A445BRA7_ARAHY|nr:hypothetical protein Ahy_A08g037603 isoform B [Arachis hypogaea]